MSDDDDPNIPDAATCQARCVEFAGVTGTDEACAQFFLQDHDWDLSRSLNSYFEARTSGAGVHVVPGGNEASAIVTIDDESVANMGNTKCADVIEVESDDDSDDDSTASAHGSKPPLTGQPPKTFSLITWNLDGLDAHNLKLRTKAVVKTIEMEAPDIVLLQELVPPTCAYLEARLPQYQLIAAGDAHYFTATLIRKYRVYYDSHHIIPYSQTSMYRNLSCLRAHIGPLKLTVYNTHLESTKHHEDVRRDQLRTCFSHMKEVEDDRVPVLAGDLNLRDSDVAAVGGLPVGVVDLWEQCGSRREVEFTWDLKRNTNKQMPARYQPRLRFDRVYQRQSAKLKADHFGLVGVEKVTGTQSFPSDHWGIQVFFSIT